jgi:carboxypeptidase C (cathepsin A)
VCEQSSGVKAYSGYVNLPASAFANVGNYDVHTYFLYFEARKSPTTAPLGIYLAGGPGEASSYAAMSSENGPCWVNPDSTGTEHNPWSFNNYMNMLYIDQPVQAGYSYSTLVNGTFDILAGGLINPEEINIAEPHPVNVTYGYGTWPDQQFNHTVNNTVTAGKALWHFAEHWLSSFPGYNTTSADISIIGNSWGGYYVPETAAQFQRAFLNLSSDHALAKHRIDTIGITNGCIDVETSILGYPEYAYNNTYGQQFASEEQYEQALNNYTMPGGCHDLIKACRAAGEEYDPTYTAGNASVNELCMEAFGFCAESVIQGFPLMNEVCKAPNI